MVTWPSELANGAALDTIVVVADHQHRAGHTDSLPVRGRDHVRLSEREPITTEQRRPTSRPPTPPVTSSPGRPTIGSLANGASLVDTVMVVAPASGSITNVARAATTTTDPNSADNRSEATTAITEMVDLQVVSSAPAAVNTMDTIVYVLTTSNNGPSSAANVAVTDSLPAGVMFVAASRGGTEIAGVVTFPVLPTLGSGGTQVDTIWVVAPTAGTLTNAARVSSATPETDSTNNRDTDVTTVDGLADLAISKAGPAAGSAGDTLVYVLTTQNGGPGPAASVTVIDSLPAGVTFLSASRGASEAAGVVTWPTLATLANGGTVSDTVIVVAAAAGIVTNTAWVSSPTADPNTADNRSTLTTTISASADLRILKTGPAAVAAGDTVVYVLNATNDGPSPATLVTVTDTLPIGVTFISASRAGTEASGVVTWPALGTLASGSSVVDTVVVLAPASGVLTNTAAISGNTADPDLANNQSAFSTTVAGSADLGLLKAAPATVAAGDTILYLLTISNTGPTAAAGVAVTDSLPAGLTFVSATRGGTHGAGVVTWPALPTLSAGSSQVDSVWALASANGTFVNVARVTSGTVDPAPANNRATASTTVTTAADVEVLKTGPTAAAPGDTLLFTLTTSNLGPHTAGSVIVTDTLPSGMIYLSANRAAVHSGGVITWPALPGLPAGTSLTDTVLALAPAGAGSYTNIAAATSATSDPNPANNNGSNPGSRVTTVVSVLSVADLAITKTGPATASPGDTVLYEILTSNLGPSAATGVLVTDTLPIGASFVGANRGATSSGGVVTWPSISALASGSSQSDSVRIVLGAAATHTNVAAVSATTPDPALSNNRATAVTGVGAGSDLRIQKTGPASAVSGDTVRYQILVTNAGPGTATGVVVVDPVPTGAQFVAASNGGSLLAGEVRWPAVSALAAGSSLVYSVSLALGGSGPVTNTASVSSSSLELNSTNNTSSAITTLSEPADVSVMKAGPPTAALGDTIRYLISVTNLGPGLATDVMLTDSLPRGVTFLSADQGGLHTGGVITWPTIGSLAAGVTATYTVDVLADDAGSRLNVAHVGTSSLDTDGTNNRATARTEVSSAPDLAIDKSHRGVFAAGSRAQYRITLNNLGGGPTTGSIVVTDTLPAGLEFVSGTGPYWSFAVNGQVVTATRSGSVAAGGTTSFLLSVDVAANATGPVLNRAWVSTPQDEDPTNDMDEDPTDIGRVDLSLNKTAVGPFEVGGEGVYRLTVTNVGSVPNHGAITVVDTLPTGLTYLGSSSSAWRISASGQVITAIFDGTLQPAESSTFEIRTRVGPAAFPAVVNTAVVETDGDPGEDENNVSVTPPTAVGDASTLVIEKRASRADVEIGDVIDYDVVVRVVGEAPVPDVEIVDRLPSGFRYVPGTARLNGLPIGDPTGAPGPTLIVEVGTLAAGDSATLEYRLSVGPGAALGDGVNRAEARSPSINVTSNVALAVVQLRAGAFSDEGMIVGKVFIDCKCGDGTQTREEIGIPGVRVYLTDGTSAVTDSEGQYHFLGLSPRTWVVKVDPLTLPAGSNLRPLSNRYARDGASVFVDLKKGEFARADFADGSGSAAVLAEVKSRREVGAVESVLLDPTATAQMENQRQVSGQALTSFRPLLAGDALNAVPSGLAAPGGQLQSDDEVAVPTNALQSPVFDRDLRIEIDSRTYRADGTTRIPVRISREASDSAEVLTLEATHGRWLVDDADSIAPGVQAYITGAEAVFELKAPESPASAVLRVSAGQSRTVSETDPLRAQRTRPLGGRPARRPDWDLRSLTDGDLDVGRGRDRFEDELTSLSIEDEDGRVRAGTRAAGFIKGTLANGYELTARIDTEEDRRTRLFRDIRPEEFYPLYGDASLQTFDAQSKGRLFARLQSGASYLQYGDFNTSFGGHGQTGARGLGAYARTLNGALQHYETGRSRDQRLREQGPLPTRRG